MKFFKKPFKIHTHQNGFVEIGRKLKRGFNFQGRFKKFYKIKTILPEIGAFLFLVLAAWALLQSARIGAIALEIKDRIISSAGLGTGNLQGAKAALQQNDLDSASKQFSEALGNFSQSRQDLQTLGKALLGLGSLLPQKHDAENLINASTLLAEAGEDGIKFAQSSGKLTFGAQGLRSGVSFRDLATELENFENKLAKSLILLKKVDPDRLPQKEASQLVDAQAKLSEALTSISVLKQLIALGQIFFEGDEHLLLLMQNNNELRPTGGFMGSFAAIHLQDGLIQNIKISSIYDLDGQLKENILPPAPILAVNDRWYLRDANWFSSFEESAPILNDFYEKEGGETPDLIVAITPDVIGGLLAITGPLETLDGIKIDSENLVERLQALTQTDPSDPVNEPKKVLGILFTKLFQTLGELPQEKKALILQALQKSFIQKQALMYSREPEAQKILRLFNWDGKLMETDRDYLAVNSANLGGTKTDLSVEQNFTLKSEINRSGEILNTLIITRANTMPTMPEAFNKSFLRVYVPLGSKLIEAKGFDNYILDQSASAGNFKAHAKIFAWEKSQVRHVVSGTLIGEESGKTFFGNWLILNPGERRTITITYTLPFKLKKLDRISLLLQKQPGRAGDTFAYNITYPGRAVEWKNFSEEQKTQNPEVSLGRELNKDWFFGMVIRKID